MVIYNVITLSFSLGHVPLSWTDIRVHQQQILDELTKSERTYRKKIEDELEHAYTHIHDLERELVEKRKMEQCLKALEENSGMSTTLFKVTGKLDKNSDRPVNKPKKSQEEVNYESLYQKVARIYPQIKGDNLPLRHSLELSPKWNPTIIPVGSRGSMSSAYTMGV